MVKWDRYEKGGRTRLLSASTDLPLKVVRKVFFTLSCLSPSPLHALSFPFPPSPISFHNNNNNNDADHQFYSGRRLLFFSHPSGLEVLPFDPSSSPKTGGKKIAFIFSPQAQINE